MVAMPFPCNDIIACCVSPSINSNSKNSKNNYSTPNTWNEEQSQKVQKKTATKGGELPTSSQTSNGARGWYPY